MSIHYKQEFSRRLRGRLVQFPTRRRAEPCPSIRISVDKIRELLAASDPNRSLIYKSVHLFVMKDATFEFAFSLSLIFNHSLDSRELSRVLIEASVAPIFKNRIQINIDL